MIAADVTPERSLHKKRFMTHARQGAWTRAILMGIYVIVTAFPFYWMFITAFKTNSDLYTLSNNPLWFNELPTFGHIIYLFESTRFGTWMMNSATANPPTSAPTTDVRLRAIWWIALPACSCSAGYSG